MLLIEYPHLTDPFQNLALEEFLLRHIVIDEPILLFYVNNPSVIIGRNQNVFEEIDFAYLRREYIPLLRRLSGGGTVYHDLGNLNYSLITPNQNLLNDFTMVTKPVIETLQAVGLTAELRNRSSIFVGDNKISGNAQYATAGKLVSHGTLLYDSDLTSLQKAIDPRYREVDSRAIQSVRSNTANLRHLLGNRISLETIKKKLRDRFVTEGSEDRIVLSESDWTKILELVNTRYRSWEWNIGRSPKSIITRRTAVSAGEIVVQISIEHGVVQKITTNTETLAAAELIGWFNCLIGVRYESQALLDALKECEPDGPASHYTVVQVLDFIY